MPLSNQTKDQILNILDEYKIAYNSHDPKALAKTLASDIMMYGCRHDEEISGAQNYISLMEKNFARYKTGSIRFDQVEIKGEGVIVWISAICYLGSINGAGEKVETKSRFTAVFRGTGHAWEIAQIHMSLGFPYTEK